MADHAPDSSDAPAGLSPEQRANLVLQQTELAHDRTQLAWVRTGFTFITAGFAIDKATEALHQARLLAGPNWVDRTHFVGLLLTGTATIGLLLATITYTRQHRALDRRKTAGRQLLPPVLLMSLLVLGLGTALFVLLLELD
jgi:uncharacterized membrane protein YidH (DUF202 family)